MIKKIITLAKTGGKGVATGAKNYLNPVENIETLARERAYVCASCDYFQDEPVDFLAIPDNRILILNKKYCEDCGCALPLKTRQSEIICKHWANL